MAVMSAQSRTHNPLCARRVEAIQDLRFERLSEAREPTSDKDRREAVSFCSYRGIVYLGRLITSFRVATQHHFPFEYGRLLCGIGMGSFLASKPFSVSR